MHFPHFFPLFFFLKSNEFQTDDKPWGTPKKGTRPEAWRNLGFHNNLSPQAPEVAGRLPQLPHHSSPEEMQEADFWDGGWVGGWLGTAGFFHMNWYPYG